MQIKILSILKVISFESLAGNDFSERYTQAEAHCERNLSHQLWSIRRKTLQRCSKKFVGIIIKAGGASVKVTDLLFAFAFCKNKPGKLVSSLIGYLLISINKFSEPSF